MATLRSACSPNGSMSETSPINEFGITRRVIGPVPWYSLSESQFSELLVARNSLRLLLTFEENLESLIESYIELESALLEIAIRHSVKMTTFDIDQVSHERLLINRRVTNLLASARQYLDQMAGIVSQLFPDNAELTTSLHQYYSNEYDNALGYRLCEALRNYALHKGHPVTNIMYQSSWEDITSDKKLKSGLSPQFMLKQLIQGKILKKSVRKEVQDLLAGGTEALELMPVMRDYVAGIGHAHENCRTALKKNSASWDEVINTALKKYFEVCKQSGPGVCIAERVITTKELLRSEFISTRLTEARGKYEQRNSSLRGLRSRYVASI